MSEKAVVSVVRCLDYEPEKVSQAVKTALELIGGIDSKLISGKRVLLKPNCLDSSHPDRGVTTHPEIFRAAAVELKKSGALLFYGDSPALDSPSRALKASGFEQAAKDLGIHASDFYTPVEISSPNGKIIKKFNVTKAVKDADFVVSLPKLKTHSQTYFTGALKNMFGIIPGLRKAEYHFKLPDTGHFSQMLVDLYSAAKPFLSIMDAVTGMEGAGPKSGRLRDIGLIIAGFDGVAVDSVACSIIGLNPMDVPTIKLADEQGVGVGQPANIEVAGESLENVKVKYFDIVKPAPDVRFLGEWLSHKVKNFVTKKPVIDGILCSSCYACINICPSLPKSICAKSRSPEAQERKPPEIDYKSCIRCYCCQEVCPKGAIKLKRNFFAEILVFLYNFLYKKISFKIFKI